MKKVLSVVVCALMVLGLAGCGVPQEKLDALKAKQEEVKNQTAQMRDALDAMNNLGVEAGIGEVLPPSVALTIDQIESDLAERDTIIANELDKMSEEEVDEALAVMDEELAELNGALPGLNKVQTQLEAMLDLSKSFEETMLQIQTKMATEAVTPEVEEDLLALQTKAGGMLTEMETIVAEIDSLEDDDFDGLANTLQKAVDLVTELHTDASNILASLEGGEAAAA